MKKIVLAASVLLFATAFLSCKKETTSGGSGIDTSFTTFMKLDDFVPTGHTVMGMDYHAPTKNLYFFMHKSGVKGYFIMQLNTETKQSLIVFTYNDGKWNNNNGSEGQRVRIFGNDLYVMGGANNTDFHRLTGIGSNTLTLAKVIKMPSYTGPTSAHWGESYDLAIADKLYVITMRSRITYGHLNDLSSPGSFGLSSSSHGASIVYASKEGNAYLLSKGGDDGKIEVRNPVNGNFLRAVTITNSNRTSLVKDSKERVYIVDNNKIIRYSPDLLSKEEFKVDKGNLYYQFTLSEEKNLVNIYANIYGELKTIKLPL
jgi:hypothetical protein